MIITHQCQFHSRRWKREQQKADILRHHHHFQQHVNPYMTMASGAGTLPHPAAPMGVATAQAAATYMANLSKAAQAAQAAATMQRVQQPPPPPSSVGGGGGGGGSGPQWAAAPMEALAGGQQNVYAVRVNALCKPCLLSILSSDTRKIYFLRRKLWRMRHVLCIFSVLVFLYSISSMAAMN